AWAWFSGRRRSASAWMSSATTASAGRWPRFSGSTSPWRSVGWPEAAAGVDFRATFFMCRRKISAPGSMPARGGFNPPIWTDRNGQGCKTQDQASVDSRYRLLLRDEQEQPHED